jgi:site-specific recombinase XerC
VPDTPAPASQATPARAGDASDPGDAESFPGWFAEFLNDRQTRKPSAHTMKAYRQDFLAIATLVTGGKPTQLTVADITKDSMRAAFATYARDHEAASIRRCWSTWNVLCTFLYTGEQLAANPMQLVGRPKLAKPLPKALPRTAVHALLDTVADDRGSKHRTDWAERDLALILTGLLAGLRAEELLRADVGDIRTTDDGAGVIHVKGKGGQRTRRAHRGRIALRHRGLPRESHDPLPRHGKANGQRRSLAPVSLASAVSAVRRA